jgi:2,5-furandicarboxylate decarboxylase 1
MPPAPIRPRSDKLDLERFSLRGFIEKLRDVGELDSRGSAVRLADVAGLLEGSAKAVLFGKVQGCEFPLAGNVMGSRERMALAFGVDARQLRSEVSRRLENDPEIVEVPRSAAPVQQVVLEGADVDLTSLPAHLHHGLDGGPYISAAMDFSINPGTGWTNVGLRRLMLRGRSETGVDLVAPSDLRAIYQASLARGESFPISFVVGAHPIDYLAGAMRVPVDELGLIASLRGTPLPVVKSITSEIRVPADAQWVIEGRLDAAGYIEHEGPFGEVLGYYGGVKVNPVFRVTAITRRRDAVFQTVTISGRNLARTDSAQLITLRTEVLVWRALESAIREPVAVYAPPATGGYLNVRVAIRQRASGEARNAIAALFGSVANVKNVFVVDPDIDIFSDEQMEWALGTRFQPRRDLVCADGFRSSPLDPSLDAMQQGSKAGYDLTVPFGASGLELKVPEAPRFGEGRFDSVRAALEDGPKTFRDLMEALGSGDGRELVLALEQLRNSGELARSTADGRYALNSRSK